MSQAASAGVIGDRPDPFRRAAGRRQVPRSPEDLGAPHQRLDGEPVQADHDLVVPQGLRASIPGVEEPGPQRGERVQGLGGGGVAAALRQVGADAEGSDGVAHHCLAGGPCHERQVVELEEALGVLRSQDGEISERVHT